MAEPRLMVFIRVLKRFVRFPWQQIGNSFFLFISKSVSLCGFDCACLMSACLMRHYLFNVLFSKQTLRVSAEEGCGDRGQERWRWVEGANHTHRNAFICAFISLNQIFTASTKVVLLLSILSLPHTLSLAPSFSLSLCLPLWCRHFSVISKQIVSLKMSVSIKTSVALICLSVGAGQLMLSDTPFFTGSDNFLSSSKRRSLKRRPAMESASPYSRSPKLSF